MHYKNGREAKEGDPVIHQDTHDGAEVEAGTLHKLQPGCDTCNAQMAVAEVGGIGQRCVTVGNCYHAEDALKCAEEIRLTREASKAVDPAG